MKTCVSFTRSTDNDAHCLQAYVLSFLEHVRVEKAFIYTNNQLPCYLSIVVLAINMCLQTAKGGLGLGQRYRDFSHFFPCLMPAGLVLLTPFNF